MDMNGGIIDDLQQALKLDAKEDHSSSTCKEGKRLNVNEWTWQSSNQS